MIGPAEPARLGPGEAGLHVLKEHVMKVRTLPTWTRRLLAFSALLLGTLLGLAAAAGAEEPGSAAVTFTNDRAPILQDTCAGGISVAP